VLVWGQDNFTLLTQNRVFSLEIFDSFFLFGQGLNTTPGEGRTVSAFGVPNPSVQRLCWDSEILSSLVDAHAGLRGEADGLDFEFFGVNPQLFFWHGQTPWLSLILRFTKVYQAQFLGIDGLPDKNGAIVSILQRRLGATFVYPNGATEAIDWAHRILIKGEKPPKTITLGTDEITTANAKEACDKYDCEIK
jgi:hypothetical protein